jgi:hydrogenase expression/formation protein HypC
MCIAMPGKVARIDGNRATVDFSGNLVEAQAGLVDIKVGDNVLVHAGCIIQVLSDEDNDFLLEILAEMQEMQ